SLDDQTGLNQTNTMARLAFLLSLLLLPIASRAIADDAAPKGHLIIHGGGSMTRDVIDRFVELGGGLNGHLVYVPTSMEGEPDGIPTYLRPDAFGKTTILHTRDPKVADTDEFIAPLKTATAIWFSGGRQWRTMDAYLGTKAADAFRAVYLRGGVIGGSSAGATVQGSYLVRGAPEGNQIMMAKGHEQGFGFLPDSAIDQHAIARGRLQDMIPIVEKHPTLLGLAIDEGTALLVSGGVATVLGKTKVAIYDAKRWSEGIPRYFFLEKGQQFELATRRLVP
ncbi:MAG: cyanophycinase, partial [Verrucomicrobiae bacterium]|nr:cyanophycinase [Verrucomicrobiae bacterium]